MSRKKGAGIAFLVIVGFFGFLIAGAYTLGSSTEEDKTTATVTPTATATAQQQEQQPTMEDRVTAFLQNSAPDRVNDPNWRNATEAIIESENRDYARLVIISDTDWSRVIMDSEFVMESFDGTGNGWTEFECGSGFMDTYSLSVQKQTESGNLVAIIAQDGKILKHAQTGAAYGMVTIAGDCA